MTRLRAKHNMRFEAKRPDNWASHVRVVPVERANDRIDEIYDDFESRTCENCIHEKLNIQDCKAGIIRPYSYKDLPYTFYNIDPFGCNRFERGDV